MPQVLLAELTVLTVRFTNLSFLHMFSYFSFSCFYTKSHDTLRCVFHFMRMQDLWFRHASVGIVPTSTRQLILSSKQVWDSESHTSKHLGLSQGKIRLQFKSTCFSNKRSYNLHQHIDSYATGATLFLQEHQGLPAPSANCPQPTASRFCSRGRIQHGYSYTPTRTICPHRHPKWAVS